jgi:thymidylate kinase
MIVNVRGTGGSGKSTVIRRVMERLLELDWVKESVFIDGRRQPYGYKFTKVGHVPVYVPGHYETACGGCDTITKVQDVFDVVRAHAGNGEHVLFEGIISQDDTTRTIELKRNFPLLIVFLTTPLEDCLAGIQKRRDERGDVRPLQTKNTTSRMKRCESHYSKLRDAGVECLKLDRETAYPEVVKRFGL